MKNQCKSTGRFLSWIFGNVFSSSLFCSKGIRMDDPDRCFCLCIMMFGGASAAVDSILSFFSLVHFNDISSLDRLYRFVCLEWNECYAHFSFIL